MSKKSIKYTYEDVTAQFNISTKKWFVLSNNKEYYFKNVLELVDSFPVLLNVKKIQYMVKLRKSTHDDHEEQKEKRSIYVSSQRREYKKELCYYCSGSGRSVTGAKCDNCDGKGIIVVMANIY